MMTFAEMLKNTAMSAEVIAELTGHDVEYINRRRTTANAPADLAADLRRTAEQRVSTCDMYIGQRALVLHNTVVVSSIHNGRGVCLQGARTIIQMFPKGMPTCYSPEDARTLCEDVNAALVEQGLEERVSCMAARDWWEEERQAALRAIAFMDKHDVR